MKLRKECVLTWRAWKAVLGLCHLSEGIDGPSWTWVEEFGPCSNWAVMTQWTLIEWTITTSRTIEPIQINIERISHVQHSFVPSLTVILKSIAHTCMCLQWLCVSCICRFTPGDRRCSWLGRPLCWWFPEGRAEESQSPRNSNNLFVCPPESWKRHTLEHKIADTSISIVTTAAVHV